MKVTVRIRLTPIWRTARAIQPANARKPRPERIKPFEQVAAHRRGAPPLAVWATSFLLLMGFLSLSMFATLGTTASAASAVDPSPVINEDDPDRPILGEVSKDCRVMLDQGGKLRCLASVEYHEDVSGPLPVGAGFSTFR